MPGTRRAESAATPPTALAGDAVGGASMATELRKEYAEIQQMFGSVPAWMQEIPPAALSGFWGLLRDVQFAETHIPNKYKELMGVALSGATRCRYCALFHTEAAKLFGASDEEIAEASAMAGITMMASTFLNAQQIDYERFRKDTLDAIAYVRQSQMSQAAESRTTTQTAPHA
jgi:AhpD family alkylhydroperoxidase